LNHIYLQAKQNNEIILQSGQQPQKRPATKSSSTRNWTPEINELMTPAKKLRGGKGQPAIYSPIFSLVKLSLELAQIITSDDRDLEDCYQKLERADRLIRQIEKELNVFN
jgi:hypothetical protein